MNKTFRTMIILAVGLIVLASCAPAAVNPYTPTRQINASGVGQVYMTPDLAYVYIGVNTKAEDVSTALSTNNQNAQAISSALTELGIEAKDIQTSAFNVYPQQEYGPNGEVLRTVYAVDNTVFVTVRDLQKLGQILDQAVRSGANSIQGVTFDVTTKTEALEQARKMAIEDARKNAEAISTAAGVKLGRVISVNAYNNPSAVAVFEGKGGVGMANSQVPVSAGQLIMTVNADMSFEIE